MCREYYYEIKHPYFESKIDSIPCCCWVKAHVIIPYEYDIDIFTQQLRDNDKSLSDYEWTLSCIPIEIRGTTVLNSISNFKDLIEKKKWHDYIDNDPLVPILSQKMKDVIEKNLTGKEGVSFIKIAIKEIAEPYTIKPYYIIRFAKMLDILNFEDTEYFTPKRFIHKPVFDREKVRNYAIAPKPDERVWNVSRCLYVSKQMKKAFKEAKLKGIVYVKHRIK